LAARSRAQAIEAQRHSVARALRCLTRTPVRIGGGRRAGNPVVILLGDGSPVAMSGDSGISFSVLEQLAVRSDDSGWHARPLAYAYTLTTADSELLAFHWHPAGPTEIRTPHLHVGARIQVGERWLPKAHIPTGLVTLTDILVLLVEELGVRALCDDWRAVLEETRRSPQHPAEPEE
jgi:hypothetical protein